MGEARFGFYSGRIIQIGEEDRTRGCETIPGTRQNLKLKLQSGEKDARPGARVEPETKLGRSLGLRGRGSMDCGGEQMSKCIQHCVWHRMHDQ